jgi:hypothetical protein
MDLRIIEKKHDLVKPTYIVCFFFFFFSIEIDCKEASKSLEYMKTKEEKKNHIKFVILLLLLSFSFVMPVNFKMEYIYTHKIRWHISFYIKQVKSKVSAKEKKNFISNQHIILKKKNNMALLWLVCFSFLSYP